MPLLAPPPKRRRRRREFPGAGAVLRKLECDRAGCVCHRSAHLEHGATHCPAHEDRQASLSISEQGDWVLWSCKAGCSQADVKVALQEKGVWPE